MTRQDELNEAWCKYMGKCCTEVMQALAFALRWCDAHPHWISVEEELPPKNEAYIAYWNHFVIVQQGRGERFFSKHITNWMPLPPAPKKGGEQ